MDLSAPATTSLSSLFAAEADRIFGFVLARCGSRAVAEDLTAEVFLDANRRFNQGRGGEVSRGWLYTVARRRLVDHWRSESARSRRLARLRAEAGREGEFDDRDSVEAESAVADALGSLSEHYRAALVLRYLEGFSVSEVADALGTTYKATESVLSRARKAFSRAYQEGTH